MNIKKVKELLKEIRRVSTLKNYWGIKKIVIDKIAGLSNRALSLLDEPVCKTCWMNFKNSMPEKGVHVLLMADGNKEYTYPRYYIGCYNGRENNKQDWLIDIAANAGEFEFTHWMPLPEPTHNRHTEKLRKLSSDCQQPPAGEFTKYWQERLNSPVVPQDPVKCVQEMERAILEACDRLNRLAAEKKGLLEEIESLAAEVRTLKDRLASLGKAIKVIIAYLKEWQIDFPDIIIKIKHILGDDFKDCTK